MNIVRLQVNNSSSENLLAGQNCIDTSDSEGEEQNKEIHSRKTKQSKPRRNLIGKLLVVLVVIVIGTAVMLGLVSARTNLSFRGASSSSAGDDFVNVETLDNINNITVIDIIIASSTKKP